MHDLSFNLNKLIVLSDSISKIISLMISVKYRFKSKIPISQKKATSSSFDISLQASFEVNDELTFVVNKRRTSTLQNANPNALKSRRLSAGVSESFIFSNSDCVIPLRKLIEDKVLGGVFVSASEMKNMYFFIYVLIASNVSIF